MRYTFTRRTMLVSGLRVVGGLGAGWLSGSKPSRLLGAEPANSSGQPDRSATAPSLPVAIGRCRTYEPQALRQTLDQALDQIGGIQKLVRNKTVTVKLNVTGGPADLAGLPGFRTYQVHPNLVAALCSVLADAGARQIVLVESQYSAKSPEEVLAGGGWDVKAIQSAGEHRVIFEDTRNRGRWTAYSRLKVPWGGFVYPAFDLNQRYEKTDVFISLAKLKDHTSAGVTMSVKNLFGIAPTSLYGGDAPNENSLSYRGDILHNAKRTVPAGVPGELNPQSPGIWRQRVPRITADLFGVRPVDLAVIDGIETNRGGEGPWVEHVQALRPGLLLVGRNAVCTDAVSTAVMGYDPQAAHGQFPFQGDNYLRLLAQVGVGAVDLKRIEVRGLSVEKALFPFNPQRIPLDLPTAQYYCPRAAQLA